MGCFDWYLIESCKLHVSSLSCVPAGMLNCTFKWWQFSQASFEDESFLLALPEEVFILFCQGTQIVIFTCWQVNKFFWIVLNSFAVSEKTRPHCGPVGMKYLSLWYISTEFQESYSKTQSSYWSISFMQGVVSNTGGTEAGTFPK